MGSLNFIHLSDLHIDASSDADTAPMTEALCNKLSEFRERKNLDQFDLLIVSGDLVNRGSDSYDLVGKTLEEICSAGGIDKNRVFMVPGNHDVDRDKCKSALYESSINNLIQRPDCLLKEENDFSTFLSPPFEKYTTFIQTFPLLERYQQFKLPGFAHCELDIDGLKVNLCGLNSALVAGPNDNQQNGVPKEFKELQNRCCGYHYLSKMLRDHKNFLNLVVSHYPLSWIHRLERQKVQQLLQQKRAILLTGHIHEETAEASGLVQSQLLQLGAGTAYGERWGGKNSCRIIELYPSRDEAFLHDWIWFGEYG